MSPILDFLTSKENLPAVVVVLRYSSAVREQLAQRFWSKFEESLKQAKPKELSIQFSWQPDFGKNNGELYAGLRDDECFGLSALFPGPRPGEVQGLKYH